jgi:hypothetical protein
MRMNMDCIDCGWRLDYYVVTDDTWTAAGLHPSVYCCLACLERRLRRPLTIDDFTACLVNRLAYAAAGKLSVLIEHERREERHREQLRIFLGGKRRTKWIDPARAIVSRSGTVHGVVSQSQSDRLTALCGFSLYGDEGPFEPIGDCVFCREKATAESSEHEGFYD